MALLAALGLALAAGCTADDSAGGVPSSSVPPKDVAPCSEVYAQDKKITAAEFGVACLIDDGTANDGELVTPLPVRITCEDDRKLYWNDLAWGFLNGPMTMTPADQDDKTPQQALDECLTKPPAG
jgi:hypothetical protein